MPSGIFRRYACTDGSTIPLLNNRVQAESVELVKLPVWRHTDATAPPVGRCVEESNCDG